MSSHLKVGGAVAHYKKFYVLKNTALSVYLVITPEFRFGDELRAAEATSSNPCMGEGERVRKRGLPIGANIFLSQLFRCFHFQALLSPKEYFQV
jgi:hypothetical protein